MFLGDDVQVMEAGGQYIEVRAYVMYLAGPCQGCGADPFGPPTPEEGEAALDALDRDFRYLKDGASGPGNYCAECQLDLYNAEGQRI